MNVSIQMVPPAEMRYNTVGDWQIKDNTLVITVAKSGDYRSNMLVGIHELIEAFVYLEHGGSESKVDEFDMKWKSDGLFEEPGDDIDAPYHKEHVLATIIERLIARDLPLIWELHEKHVENAAECVEKALNK